MPFQTAVNANPAPGLEGGWASANPHASMLTPGNGDPALATYSAWTVGPAGQVVGRFGFANLNTGQVQNTSFGIASNLQRVGFVHRYQPVVVTGFLQQSGATLYTGQEVDICDGGDFWTRFPTGGTLGQKVFASYADGSATTGAAGATPTAAAGNVTTTSGSANLTAVTGSLYPGSPVSGTGIPAGAYIVSVGSGTAVLSANATASGTVAVTQTTAYETRWFLDSLVASSDLGKISTRG